MIRILSHVLLFVIVFMVDVHIKAKVPNNGAAEASVVEVPEGCVRRSGLCAVEAKGGRSFHWDLSSVSLGIKAGSRLARGEAEQGVLLAGQVLVESRGEWKLETSFGDLEFNSEDRALVEREQGYVEVTVLTGRVLLAAKGHTSSLVIPAGYTLRFSAVAEDGRAQVEIPQAALGDKAIREWARLFDGRREDFMLQARAFRESWKLAVEAASELHQTLRQRRVAAVAEERRQRALRRMKIEAENARLRALFRKKNYLNIQ